MRTLNDLTTVALFALIILSPCFIALHATLGEEDFTLGYAASYRRAKARLIDVLRV